MPDAVTVYPPGHPLAEHPTGTRVIERYDAEAGTWVIVSKEPADG